MSKFTIKHNKSAEDLKALFDQSAITMIGCFMSDENLQGMIEVLEECGAEFKKEPTFIVTSGKLMNETYHLTGSNAYKDDLNIVSIANDDYEVPFTDFYVKRLAYGFRWFDDIVCNDLSREREMVEAMIEAM